MEKYKKLFSNTIIFAFSSVLSKAILSLMLPLYTRTMTTAEYGRAELLTTISQLVIPICSVAIPEAVFRFSMDKEYKQEDVIKTGAVFMIWSALMLIVFSSGLNWFEPLSGLGLFFFMISFLTMIRLMFSLYTQATGNTKLFSLDNILYNLMLSLFNVIFLAGIKIGLVGYFMSMVLANLLSVLFLLTYGKIYKKISTGKFKSRMIKAMVAYSAPLILTNISWALMSMTDKVMITKYISVSENGIYSAAAKIPALVSLVTEIFSQAWVLSAIQDYGENDDKKFYENVFFLMHIALCSIVLGIFAVNNFAIPFILGKDFEKAALYTPMLVFGTFFTGYSAYYSPIFSALKKNSMLMWSTLFGVTANIVLNALLIRRIGTGGACVATVISSATVCFVRMAGCRKYMDINIEFLKWILSVLCIFAALMFVVLNIHSTLLPMICYTLVILMYRERLFLVLKKFAAGFGRK